MSRFKSEALNDRITSPKLLLWSSILFCPKIAYFLPLLILNFKYNNKSKLQKQFLDYKNRDRLISILLLILRVLAAMKSCFCTPLTIRTSRRSISPAPNSGRRRRGENSTLDIFPSRYSSSSGTL